MRTKVLELGFLLNLLFCLASSKTLHYVFNVELTPYTRLCYTKKILTVNGLFPGPTLYAHRGDTIIVKVYNNVFDNITVHWHGVKQSRNPWSDGPAYITQCPIQAGSNFSYKVKLSDEEGTIWWHAHSDWARATVHGAIVVRPKRGSTYPFFPLHKEEVILILGEWWKEDVNELLEQVLTGERPNASDAYTINGQPGDLCSCSSLGTFRMLVQHGATYLLRMINAGMSNGLFFSVYNHRLTVVGADGSYTKPFTTTYLFICPGESMDVLLEADQSPDHLYYMAASAFSFLNSGDFDNSTVTAILEYATNATSPPSPPLVPSLPRFNDTIAAFNFSSALKSLNDEQHQIQVPKAVNRRIFITVSVNEIANKTRLLSSLNNISFSSPSIDILQAYYNGINGVFGDDFPVKPPYYFNFTADDQPESLLVPSNGTKVLVLEFGDEVEMVFQGTSLVLAESHPIHLHGFSFYVVGMGFGNFDNEKDPETYNLVDPARKNTVGVPRDGWVAVRFKAQNPGVWFMHCHFERHLSSGMDTVVIVKNGDSTENTLLPPPPYMPPC